MNTCKDSVSLNNSLTDIDYLSNRFHIIDIYRDKDAFVAKAIDNETNIICIIKEIVQVNKELLEMRINCLLFDSFLFTDSILLLDNWALTQQPIFSVNPSKKDLSSKALILKLPFLQYSLLDLLTKITLEEKLSLLFELCVGILVLKKYNIVHDDLHEENILIKECNYYRHYVINDQSFIVRSRYLPLIIDFGRSFISDDIEAQYVDDFHYFPLYFSSILKRNNYQRLKRGDFTLLLDDIFNFLRLDNDININDISLILRTNLSVRHFQPINIT